MTILLERCPFCQCTMQIVNAYGSVLIDGEHSEACILHGGKPVAMCPPGQKNLEQMVDRWNTRVPPKKVLEARGHVGNALDIVGQIRQGSNVPSHELWNACEYLEKALSVLPRPA